MKFDNDDGSLLALGAIGLLAAGATAMGARGSSNQILMGIERQGDKWLHWMDVPDSVAGWGVYGHRQEHDTEREAKAALQSTRDWIDSLDLDVPAVVVPAGSPARGTPIAVGDGVQYKAAFLRSIGEITGPMPFAKGTVTEINQYGKTLTIATIDWGDDEIPPRVNVNNLKRIKDWEPN